MAESVSENLAAVTDRVRRAARKVGRTPDEITLVVVTKDVDVKTVKEAVSSGARVLGESYIQEAVAKKEKIRDKSIRWHFIGHLQKNKAKVAVEMFDLIHSIDSFELAKELNKKAKKPLDVLIGVNIAREKTKSGVTPDGAVKLAREIAELPNLRLKGLMTIPPFYEDPEISRPYFITLRRLAERINRERLPGVTMHSLSMGMSNDFEVAIEEGSTLVRVGTAIFGPRTPKKKGAKKD